MEGSEAVLEVSAQGASGRIDLNTSSQLLIELLFLGIVAD